MSEATTVIQRLVNRFTGAVLFECEVDARLTLGSRLGLAVKAALRAKADLSWADLSWANLSEANLSEADLSWADLSWADLSEANLSEADLSKANLSEANLSEANLSWANLSWANLSEANLSKADLSWADLSWANLSKANLSEANLSWANLSKADSASLRPIKTDLFDVLIRRKGEVAGLLAALREGRINGSVYEGECACLLGTIANIASVPYCDLGPGLAPDSARPIERWFMGLSKGDKPDNHGLAKITEAWILEFMQLEGIADPAAVVEA
ncbi:pentapeptide repeat-containing protein [Ferrovibrio sp.]|uniref:pentapeptide repeat-containing protein n=1 Tax=Ferrovibrio sp. TaxID=1917215 RepID=UPI0035B42FB7